MRSLEGSRKESWKRITLFANGLALPSLPKAIDIINRLKSWPDIKQKKRGTIWSRVDELLLRIGRFDPLRRDNPPMPREDFRSNSLIVMK